MIERVPIRSSLLLVAGLAAAPISGQMAMGPETIRTRALKAHVEAFMSDCAKDKPTASCWCTVKKMNATADGQFSLDVSGMLRANPRAGKAEFLDAMNRHNLRPSQAEAAISRSKSAIVAAVKDCD